MTSCASAPNCDYVLHAFRRRLSPSPLPPAPAPLNVGGVQYTPNILMCVGVCVFWLVICIISRLQRVVRIVCARWSAVNPVPSPKSKHATDRFRTVVRVCVCQLALSARMRGALESITICTNCFLTHECIVFIFAVALTKESESVGSPTVFDGFYNDNKALA